MERVASGIPGLDELTEGGFPEGHSILVSGSPGTGKSIFGLQFLYDGALKNEPGVYITFEEKVDKIILHAKRFGWDLQKLIDKKLLIIESIDVNDIEKVIGIVSKRASEIKAKRLVVDSLSKFSLQTTIRSDVFKSEVREPDAKLREIGSIYFLITRINALGMTSVLISELPAKTGYFSRDGVSEFECDGLILLENTGEDRLITVHKMRGTKINTQKHVFVIENGLKIVGD